MLLRRTRADARTKTCRGRKSGAFGTVYTVFREHGHANGAATQPHALVGQCRWACSLGLSYSGQLSRISSKEAPTARAMSRELRGSAPAASRVAHQQTPATKQATDGKLRRGYDQAGDSASPRPEDRLLDDLREAHLHRSTQRAAPVRIRTTVQLVRVALYVAHSCHPTRVSAFCVQPTCYAQCTGHVFARGYRAALESSPR